MEKNSLFKWLILIVLVLFSVWVVYPPKEKINLGIDLKGGYSFILEVDVEELEEDQRRDAQERALEIIRNRIDSSGTREPIIYPEPGSMRIVVQLPGQDMKEKDEILRILKQPAHLAFRMVHEKNDELALKLYEEKLAPRGYELVDVTKAGDPRPSFFYRKLEEAQGGKFDNKKSRAELKRFQAPSPTYEFLLEKEEYQGQTLYSPYYVSKRQEVTGEHLKNAMPTRGGQFNMPQCALSFNAAGAKKFGETTSNYAPGGKKNPDPQNGRQMAVVLDDTVYSAPVIRVPIYDGNAVIEGSFTAQQVQELAIVLRAGSLPAPINVLEERSVEPTLGRAAVKSGLHAAMYGGTAVIIFMFFYYMLAGVVVNLALLLDAILLPLGMLLAAGFLGIFVNTGLGSAGNELPTLTLPGIAGLVLTIGMAVDANVLIFERIREEQNLGKRFASAIQSGYEKVFSTIFDANITTLLVAVILFMQGSGPIRGFAVTLSAGIIVSMFTALVFTRLLFDQLALRTKIEKLKMLHVFTNPNFDFLGKRFVAAILSLLVIAGTWTMFIKGGTKNFGVDFTGGRSFTYLVDQENTASENEIRAVLSDAGISDAYIQFQQEVDTGRGFVEIKVGHQVGDQAKGLLEQQLNANKTTREMLMQDEAVGPQIGRELKWKGIKAIVFALIGIVIYISFRFEFAFAMGAITALAHDVLITVGIYCLFGRQLSLPIIAALLTIVGYSVNDTIVVFDRIREDLKLIKHKPYSTIANLSINQTLSRTLLTSLTTLLTVVMLLVFGGGAIFDFALALLIGIMVGTYSSIFVATPVMLLWHKEKTGGRLTVGRLYRRRLPQGTLRYVSL